MTRTMRKVTAGAFAGLLLLGGAACSDEDGDGATTDEEVGELEQDADQAEDELQQEIDEGQNETGDNEENG